MLAWGKPPINYDGCPYKKRTSEHIHSHKENLMKDEGMMGLTQQKPRNAQDCQQTTRNQRSNMGQILP